MLFTAKNLHDPQIMYQANIKYNMRNKVHRTTMYKTFSIKVNGIFLEQFFKDRVMINLT